MDPLDGLWRDDQDDFLDRSVPHELGHAACGHVLSIRHDTGPAFSLIRVDPATRECSVDYSAGVRLAFSAEEQAALILAGLYAEREAYDWEPEPWLAQVEFDSGTERGYSDCLKLQDLADIDGRSFGELAEAALKILHGMEIREIVRRLHPLLRERLSLTYDDFVTA